MKKKLKRLYTALLTVLVILIATVVIIDVFGGRAVKMAIETAATKALNVGVSVKKVNLSIVGG